MPDDTIQPINQPVIQPSNLGAVVPLHIHNNVDAPAINPNDLLGFPIYTSVPTYPGKNGQVIIVRSGANPNETWYMYSWMSNAATPGVFSWQQIAAPQTPASKSNVASFDISGGSGNQVIAHGLGKTPTIVEITSYSSNGGYPCTGRFDADGQRAAEWANGNGYIDTTSIIYYRNPGPGDVNKAVISVDSTNITLAWTIAWSIGFYNFIWKVE